MAWQPVGQASYTGERKPIHKWNSVGQTVEGVYRGTREGKYGPLAIVQTSGGEVACATSKLLVDRLAGLRDGDLVKIEYLGKKKGQSGYEYKDFQVFMDVPPRPTSAAHPASAERAAVTDGTTGLASSLTDSIEFVRLTKLIEQEKGAQTAKIIADAARSFADPVGSLRSAMGQLGIVPF